MTEDNVNEEDIHHISDLALLDISGDDIEEFRSQFNDILDKFSRLDEVDLEDAEKEDYSNVLRRDEEGSSIDTEKFMDQQGRETDSKHFEN